MFPSVVNNGNHTSLMLVKSDDAQMLVGRVSIYVNFHHVLLKIVERVYVLYCDIFLTSRILRLTEAVSCFHQQVP